MIQKIYCNCYNQFLNKHQELLQSIIEIPNVNIYYRGQASSNWDLEPKLSRDSNRIFNPVTYTEYLLNEEEFSEAEREIANRILGNIDLKLAYQSLRNTGSVVWELDPRIRDLWIFARHQGYLSPLLDLSYSLDVATYFAVEEVQESNRIAIFMFIAENYDPNDPQGLKNGDDIMVRFLEPFHHSKTLERHKRQQGLYAVSTLLGSNQDRHTFQKMGSDQILKGAMEKLRIFKFLIPKSERHGIKERLAMDGITKKYLFPDN